MSEESPPFTPEPHCPLAHITEITPCPQEELQPLIDWLKDGGEELDAPRPFTRGTALPEGRLDLCKQDLGVTGARRVFESMAQAGASSPVRHILMGTDGLGDEGARALADYIDEHDGLETVYLGCNKIGAEGARALATSLQDSERARALWLKRNPLRYEGALAIAELLRHNHSLRTLDLNNCELGERGVIAICEALHDNQGVERLYLGANGIGPRGAEAIAALLQKNDRLVDLFLSINQLGDAGAEALSTGLPGSKLQLLSLASNAIGPRGIAALVEGMRRCEELVYLDLGRAIATEVLDHRCNALTDDGVRSIAAWLADDPPLRQLILDHNELTTHAALAIEESLESNQHLSELALGKGIARKTKRRIRKRLQENEATQGGPLQVPEDVRCIWSVYRTAL